MVGRLRNSYFKWLKDMVLCDKNHNYNLLFKDLHGVRFRWFVELDINRAFEGKNLRGKFCDSLFIDMKDSMFFEEASLLEVMIAMALRCEWIVMDDINNLDVCYWFEEFLHNLELDIFTDDEYYDHGGQAKIGIILDRFMNRTYAKNGKGGLFPLKKCVKNQRKIELWYQMNSYLVENYGIDKM